MTNLSNKAYNVIKYLITIFLPAVGALYFLLAQVWDFSRISGVNGTINALITFGGLLIGYSSKQYQKVQKDQDEASVDGELLINDVDGDKTLSLGIKHDSFAQLPAKERVTLNVVTNTPAPVTDTKPSA